MTRRATSRIIEIDRRRMMLYASVALVAFLLIASHRPDAVLNPQFWAEDGRLWYSDAYNRGILYSPLTPEVGYFQTISRLTAVAAQAVPLTAAPALFNLTAIGVKLAAVVFLVS